MDAQWWLLLGALVLVAVVALLMGHRLGRFELRLPGFRAEARATTPTGVRVSRSKAGRDIRVDNTGDGAVEVDNSSAGRDIVAQQRAEEDHTQQ